jgi:hypothetical protein
MICLVLVGLQAAHYFKTSQLAKTYQPQGNQFNNGGETELSAALWSLDRHPPANFLQPINKQTPLSLNSTEGKEAEIQILEGLKILYQAPTKPSLQKGSRHTDHKENRGPKEYTKSTPPVVKSKNMHGPRQTNGIWTEKWVISLNQGEIEFLIDFGLNKHQIKEEGQTDPYLP